MEKKYYIYAHINPLKNEIFYIGKGSGKRANWKHKRSDRWHNTVNKYGYIVDILEDGLTEEQAFEREIWYIKRLGRRDLGTGRLINMTDGGDNPPSNLGKKHTDAAKAKMSLAAIGNTKSLGKKHSDETKAKLSILKTGDKNPQYGVIHTDEYKENMRIKSTGKKHTDAAKLKVSLSKKGKPLSEEHKAKLRKPKTKKNK